MRLVFSCLMALLVAGCDFGKKTHTDAYGDKLGTVKITLSCNEEANALVERGIALLHHMTYVGARATFVSAAEADPDCAMAYWGQAMSLIHPLWSDPPSEQEFSAGQELLAKAKASSKKSEEESAYIAAVEAYYAKGRKPKEGSNLASFANAWKKVYRQYPDDLEAASFYALALMATAKPADKSYAKQREAGTIAQKVLTDIPDHPGAHHYTIHAYDYPPLAKDALEVAHGYGSIAPAIPHALHMPTHIFTRLGYWQESIDMNRKSAAAALKHPAGDQVSLHYLHALDYLAYAHLQRAEDKKAKEVLETIENLKGPYQPHGASAYTFAAVPARIALERQEWADAAKLKPRTPENYPWGRFPAMESLTYYARALGAARSGDKVSAAQALDKLAELRDEASETSTYWAKQVEIQRRAAKAWLVYAEGNKDQGLLEMTIAAELEATTEKHPITPGEVLPARELYADMLMEFGQHKVALVAYETALKRNPNRLNSLYGAGHAAELAGDKEKASLYYGKLMELTKDADTQLPRVQKAKEFLKVN